jgi:hypothetical protein
LIGALQVSPRRWRADRPECSIGLVLGRLFGLLVVLAAFPTSAAADRVVVLGPGGHATMRNDPFLTTPAELPPPGAMSPVARPASRGRTVRNELARIRRKHAISRRAYDHYLSDWTAALRTARKLRGTRSADLKGVIANLRAMASARALSASRLPALFLTLERNRTWWTTGPLLSYGARVEFNGSPLIWEYYPGQGIEITVLGNFGKADGYYTGGHRYWPLLRKLLRELIPLAARRAHGVTWEYYFSFDGGVPPWTSAMSQGTALEALSDAYKAFHDPSYLAIGRRALPVFTAAPPTGVSVTTRRGRRYLLYSFAPRAAVINGFLQTLIGLLDFARRSGSPEAMRLFAQGDAEARHELPHYDTGHWSLYQPGELASVDYQRLVTGFLQQLCSKTREHIYCLYAARFEGYLQARGLAAIDPASELSRMPGSIS